jgi:hypothetical protein
MTARARADLAEAEASLISETDYMIVTLSQSVFTVSYIQIMQVGRLTARDPDELETETQLRKEIAALRLRLGAMQSSVSKERLLRQRSENFLSVCFAVLLRSCSAAGTVLQFIAGGSASGRGRPRGSNDCRD